MILRPAFICFCLLAVSRSSAQPATRPAGDWPEPRQNSHLTAVQRTPGRTEAAPTLLAQIDLGRSPQAVMTARGSDQSLIGLSLHAGELLCYAADGALRWRSHPAGLNFSQIVVCEDLNGDGRNEIALQAGRPGQPYGAACLVSADDGALIWRYDVDPMSYAWYLYAGKYLPGSPHKQLVVIMQGYPPDAKNGYISLFDFPASASEPQQKWRYDFDRYTCFPTFLPADLDGDGTDELNVQTHSRMWSLDAASGTVKQFVEWDVSPANIRSYGFTEFVDLNGDGLKDYLCIANFAQHHEVLLNDHGKLKEAWHQGWPESVTVGTVATNWPLPPYADIDGDGKPEIVVSMFNSESERAWLIRVYDAATGKLKYRIPGMIAASLVDLYGDGAREILADASTDSADNLPDGGHATKPHAGMAVFKARDGVVTSIWKDAEAHAVRSLDHHAHFVRGEQFFALSRTADGALMESPAAAVPASTAPSFTNLPAVDGGNPPELLAADLMGTGRNDLLSYRDGKATFFTFDQGAFKKVGEYRSTSIPVIGDFDGDGRFDLVLSDAAACHQPKVKAITPSQQDRVLWDVTLSPPAHPTLPKPRPAYLRTAHFAGRKAPDLYAWFSTPSVRSVAIEGSTGKLLWETGELPGIERYVAPTQNLASSFDFNADGHEDLVFTNPDYYCVASGIDGTLLLGPLFPPNIFSQPSQGLYTFPAILSQPANVRPKVALVDGHYFQGVMSVDGVAAWYRLPDVGQNRTAAEGFAQLPDGNWLMGVGRQNGKFACINISDGSTRWELDVQASCSDIIACDINGDGQLDFLFGTSHGKLYAVTDAGDKPRIVWQLDLGAPAAAPIAADIDGDGRSEVIVPTLDGRISVWR